MAETPLPAPALLFVCLGNICRSPMAEGAMRAALAQAGLDWPIDSAGTGAWHVGNPPDGRGQMVAMAHGVDISDLRARQVTAADFTHFTHIFAMDHENLRNLASLAPDEATAKLSLLLDWLPGHEGQPVEDPYYGGAEGFETTWANVHAACARIVERLR